MHSISRRRFIEESIFASAALTTATSGGLWLPKPVRAQEITSPNEKLGVLLVGCGGRCGRTLASTWSTIASRSRLFVILTPHT